MTQPGWKKNVAERESNPGSDALWTVGGQYLVSGTDCDSKVSVSGTDCDSKVSRL